MFTIPKINSELAEEVGWHIGDGSMNYYKNSKKMKEFYQLRGHIEDDKPHYLKRIKPLFESLYGIKISLRDMPSTRVFGFQIWNNDLIKFKKKLGLPLGKKFNVFIPGVFLQSDALKIAVIRGIFDTDGGIYLEKKNGKLYPKMEIQTISYVLSEQLLKTLRGLGFRATRHSWLNPIGNRKRAYVISVRGVDMFRKFMNEINPQNFKHQEKYKKFIASQNL